MPKSVGLGSDRKEITEVVAVTVKKVRGGRENKPAVSNPGLIGKSPVFHGDPFPEKVAEVHGETACHGVVVGVDPTSTEMTSDIHETKVVAPVLKENRDPLTRAITIPDEDGKSPIGVMAEVVVSTREGSGADVTGPNRGSGLA